MSLTWAKKQNVWIVKSDTLPLHLEAAIIQKIDGVYEIDVVNGVSKKVYHPMNQPTLKLAKSQVEKEVIRHQGIHDAYKIGIMHGLYIKYLREGLGAMLDLTVDDLPPHLHSWAQERRLNYFTLYCDFMVYYSIGV